MKRLVLLTTIITLVFSQKSWAGGLNHIGGIGSRAGGMSGASTAIADDSSLFFYNPAGMAQFSTTYVDAGLDVIFPRFNYDGHKSKDGIWHSLPYAGIISPISDEINFGLGLTVPYGMGASFERNGLMPQSETLISLTNISPSLSLRLTDNFYAGIGLNIGYGQFKYQAPFDINGFFLPIGTDNEADGFGLSATFGLMYKPTERLSLGLAYMSEEKINLNGESDISFGPISLHDKFKSDYTFPPRLGAGIAYRLTPKFTVGFDANWYGYSKTVNSMTLDFAKLPLKKTTNLDWRDNYSLHLGARYRINDFWWLRGGIGYQTKAVPDATISQLTPDATGLDLALGLECQREHFSGSLAAIYGWGENNVKRGRGVLYPGKYEAKTLTVLAQIGWQW